MKNYLSILFLFFLSNCFGQVEEIIDNLVGKYSSYDVTDLCDQSITEEFTVNNIEIIAKEGSDTLILNYEIELFGRKIQNEKLIIVELQQDSTGIFIKLNTISNDDMIESYTEIIGVDSLSICNSIDCFACTCGSKIFMSKEGTTNIIETKRENLNIFPNPANQFITISKANGNIFEEAEITLTSLDGKIIYNKNVQDKPYLISLRDVKNGIYLIQVKDGNTYYSQKLIKLN